MEIHARMCIICTWIFLEFKESSAICTVYDLLGNNKNDVFECNYPATLSCSNRPNAQDIEWYIGKHIDSNTPVAAQCRGTVCQTFDTFSGRYSYSFDQNTGIANITIRNVSSNDKGLEYRCEDGSTPPPFAPKTKVFPNDKTTTTNIFYSDVNNLLNFTVSTDCVLLSRNMSFIWKKTKNENGTDLESFTPEEISRGIVISQNVANCTQNGSCGEMTYISTLLFKPGNFGERFYIHCTIVVNDEYGPENITRISTTAYQFTVSGTNELVCDKSKCIPCWAFGVILEGIVCIAIIVVFIVHISGAYANDTKQMNVLKGSLFGIVVLAHIAVILAARFCKDENNCADIICLPCWVYWVIQNGIIISTIECVILVNVLCDNVKTSLCYWKVYAIVGIATHAAIILAAEYCRMWDTREEKRCLPCWVYGSILAGIILVAVVCAILIKICYPDGRIGGLWYWEMFALAGFFIVTIYLVFVVIFAGACKKNDEISDESFGCWAIYLVIFGIIVISVTCCMFIYAFIEPVRSAKVISRKVDGKGMSIRVLWESRLTDLKTYYIRLECKEKMLDPIELDHKYRQDGFLEYELTGLILDTDYQARLYSVVCKLPSLNNQITFDTKGRPMPPTKIYQDEEMRTEDSITLHWTAAKGPVHHFIIKYKRSKRQNSDWVNSEKVSGNWCTINGLRPGTSYAIIIYAENNLGRSEESETLFVKTRALKPVPPQQFKCTSSTENEIHLSWKPSKKLKNQQFLLTVFNNSEDRTKYEQKQYIKYSGEQTMKHTVSQLNPGCEYQFEICTLAGNVLSASSRIVIAETKGIRKEQLNDLKQTTATTVFLLKNEK